MKTTIVAASAVAALALAAPLHAQRVSADVVVRTGPVRGHVAINDGYSTYRRAPVVVYERPTRVIVVERFRHRGDFRRWKQRGFRRVTVFYVDGRYYDHYNRHRPGVREVVVYERDGRYYHDCYDRDYRDHRDHRDYRDRDDYRDR